MDGMSSSGSEVEFEDAFEGDSLDLGRWIPHYLPHWSSRERSAARYEVADRCLRLLITADQEPWCPELDGEVRVSSLQTGVFAGPVGSSVGQHRFNPEAVVREAQENRRLYTPQYGRIELRAKAADDPGAMVALWLIGYEDEPERSAEICVCEIFGRDVGSDEAAVGMGVHPFGDPSIVDDFSAETLPIDVREFHVYAADWTPEHVAFFVDGELVKTVQQSPAYPMQLMLGIYELERAPGTSAYPKAFVVDYVRGYRLSDDDRELRAHEVAQAEAVERPDDLDPKVAGEAQRFAAIARPVHDDAAWIVGALGVAHAADRVPARVHTRGRLVRGARDSVAVQNEDGRVGAVEARGRGSDLGLLRRRGGRADGALPGRVAHLFGERFAQNGDARDEQDGELDRRDGARNEGRGAPWANESIDGGGLLHGRTPFSPEVRTILPPCS
jgi:hypothetical protein